VVNSQDTKKISQILKKLNNYTVNIEILVQTKIGKTVKKLAKHKSEQVAKLAQSLVKRYRKVMLRYVKSGGEQLPLPAQNEQEENVNNIKSNEETTKEIEKSNEDTTKEIEKSNEVTIQQTEKSTDNISESTENIQQPKTETENEK